jgi:outer membrane receptor for ferrienterochelin and colicins
MIAAAVHRPRRGPIRLGSIAAFVFALGSLAYGQIQHGSIRGSVTGPDGLPVDRAVITLMDGLGEPLQSVVAEAGRFQVTNVAPGTYSLRAEAPLLRGAVQRITVTAALPIDVELRLSTALTQQVIVSAQPEDTAPVTSRVTLAGDAVRRAPTRLRSRALQDAIATAPGWATEDNGILHVRGVDDGFLYVVDGVPIYERIDGLFGISPDPAMIDSLNVITGHIPAEFGLKAGAVVEVRSTARRADAWTGAVDLGAGSERTGDFSTIAGGPIAAEASLTAGLTGHTSDRFLDSVHPDNLHNRGGSLTGGGQLAWTGSAESTITAVGGFGRSRFDVPHGEPQEDAGQDQRQRVFQQWQTVSWQRSWSAHLVSHLAGYHRFGSSGLSGSAADTPLFSDAERSMRRIGVLASLTRGIGRHLLKVGGEAARLRLRESFVFAVTDPDDAGEADLSDAAAAYTPDDPFTFADAAAPTLFSVYAQDTFRALDRLSVDVGVRVDWSRMLAAAAHVSPRVGAAYRLPSTDTTVRASFGRFFQPPQAENLLLASSPEARGLSPFVSDGSAGGSDLRPERQTAIDVGVDHLFARAVRVGASYWRRRMRDVADPNVFFGTTLIFPNTVAKGRASGVDVRLDVPRRGGWSGYASYANSRVVQFGPITGGLFLERELIEIGPGTAFVPDHDQRHVGAAGISYDHEPTGFSAAMTARYESGTPLEAGDEALDELMERPGAERVDFDRGRVKPRRILDARVTARILRGRRVDADLRVAVLNLTANEYAFNFGNPFSGTHFGPGRTAQVGIRLQLR